MNICIINGPNINMLGTREQKHYGVETWDEIEAKIRGLCNDLRVDIKIFQSNHEGDIVDYIQKNSFDLDGIIINPAAFTKTGYSILDALLSVKVPFIEVHLSNIYGREKWRSESIFSEHSIGQIIGFKGMVYGLAIEAIIGM